MTVLYNFHIVLEKERDTHLGVLLTEAGSSEGRRPSQGLVVHGVFCHQDQPPYPTALENNTIAARKNLMCRTSAAIVIKERG